jgi:hypothetical protein
VFTDEREVESTIKNLIEKGVLKSKIHFLYFPPPGVPDCGYDIVNHVICEKLLLRRKKFIDFANADIRNEGWIIISGQFSATVNAAFTPNASQDSKNRKSLL